MKLTQLLLEMPYYLDIDHSDKIPNTYQSDDALIREYNQIGTMKIPASPYDVKIHQMKNGINVHATVKVIKGDDVIKNDNLIVCDTQLSEVYFPNVLNPIQVKWIYAHPEYRQRGVAAYVYFLLAKKGYTVISDNSQYRGGKMLWKKIAEEAKTTNFKVRIYDNKKKDWLKDKDSKIITYDGSNIDDADIWTSGANFKGKFVLLSLHDDWGLQ